MRAIRLLFIWLVAGNAVSSIAFAQTILMITTGATPNAQETARQTQLQNWGYAVTTVADSSVQATIDAAVLAADAVYVPCTIDDWELLYKLRTATKGVVTETPGLDTEFGYTTADGYTQSVAAVEGLVNMHPVTSGLTAGTVTMFSSSQNMALNGNTVASGMTVLATLNWGQMSLGVIEQGGTLANTYNGNSTASGRRVRLPWGWSISFSALNSNGLTLLHNALDWAVGKKLLLHYKLDQSSGSSVTDSSGNNYTGTVSGTATWISAIRNNGFDFNGATKIQVNSELGQPANISVAAWVKVDSLDSYGGEVVSIGDHVILRLTTTAVQAHLYNGSNWTTTSTNYSPVGAGWHHYAFTFDDAANQLKIYIDGQLATTATVNISISYSGLGTATVVGQHGNGNTNMDLDGSVDDIRLYSYALSQAEVAVIYGLVGHYKLDETAGTTVADSSGADNAGTVTGTANWTTANKGNGFRFNYTDGDDYVTIPNSTSLQNVQEDDYSLSLWFKPNSEPPGAGFANNAVYGLVLKSTFPVGLGYGNGQKFGMSHPFSDSSVLIAETANTFAPGTYHHVVAVVKRAAGTLTLYVNGQVEASLTFTPNKSAYEQGTGPWRLGINSPGAGTYRFAADGTLDDVRIYNRALTSEEISQLYGTAGQWALNESSGTLATDSSGANNHGTFVSGPTLGQAGVYDLATTFNSSGTTQYLSLPRQVIHGASTVSASFWIKTTTTGEQAIVSGSRVGMDNEFLLHFLNSTTFRIYCHGNMQGWTIPSIADGNWHHFVVVSQADTNTSVLYLDNVFMGSRAISAGSTPFSIDTGGLIVAQEQDSVGGSFVASQSFRGTLDELRLFQRALTSKEVGQLFGLMGHWAFNEGAGNTVADASGAGLDASIIGATWTSDCAGNSALDFDGKNDVAATSSTFDPPNEGTVCFWFRSNGPPVARQRLWGVGPDFEMWQDPDGLLSCDVSTDGFQGGFITTTPLYEAGRWYHVVAQYDCDTDSYEIYLDGEYHKSGVSTWAITNQPADNLTFGTRTGSTEFFNGAIRDFRIYNRPMFSAEIATAAGILGHWQLNETSGTVADDMAVSGNDATYVGSPTLGVDGSNPVTNGTAVDLNGTSQYLTSGKSLLNGLSEFTLCAWVRPESITPDKSFLGQTGLIELGIDTSSDRIDFWTSAGGSLSTVKQLATAKWTHIAAVGDGAGLRLYVNGVEVDSGGSATANYGSNSSTFKIGEGVITASGGHFDGRMDDVRVYSRALCPGEIYEIYQGGRPAGLRIIKWVETR